MVIINNENKSIEVVIDVEGAEILSVRRDSYEYMWQANKKIWGRTAPVLFPIVGRLKDDSYKVNNVDFEMTQHGFARDMDFEIIEQSETSVTLQLQSTEQTKEKYPYDFTLSIKYTMKNDDLSVEYIVENKSTDVMHYSIGAHPGFNLNPGAEYSVNLNNVTSQYTLEGPFVSENIPTEQTNFKIESELFANDAIILANEIEEKVVTITENGSDYIKMKYDDFKLLGIWAPYNEELPFVCLEPWNGIADYASKESNELRDKEFINELAANESSKQKYTITFY